MKNQNSAARQPRPNVKANEEKWTKPIMAAGWVGFPAVFVERQQALRLDALDLNILLHLVNYWWTKDRKPFPSKKTIADAIGVTPRTVQRHIADMEKDGLIQREERRIPGQGSQTNIYHFDGLIKSASPYAEEKLEKRKQRKQEDEATRRRKGKPPSKQGKPPLQLVRKTKR